MNSDSSALSNDFVGPASLGQRLLWTFERRHSESGALSTHVVVRLRGTLDRERLADAVSALTARHESLRARLHWSPPRLLRVVSKAWRPTVQFCDLSMAVEPSAAAQQTLNKEVTASLHSSDWPLRCVALTMSATDHVVCLNVHHMATDWLSGVILLEDLAALYEGKTLPAASGWEYSQWIEWQESQRNSKKYAKALAYWNNQLQGAVGCRIPELPGVADPRRLTGYEHGLLDGDTVAGLTGLAATARAPLFCVGLAVFYVAAHALTGRTDLALTTIVSERDRCPEVARTVGYFISTIALRTSFQATDKFDDLIRKCRSVFFGATEHQMIPLRALPAALTRQMDPRVEDVVFQMVRGSADVPAPFERWDWRPDVGRGRTFDLEMMLQLLDRSAMVNVLYGTHRYSPGTIAALIRQFCSVARTVALKSDLTVAELASNCAAS